MNEGILTQREGNLYAGEHRVLKGWESFSGWFWFGTEQVKGEPGVWFGFVQGFENEWGYFSMEEMRPLIERGAIWPIKPYDLPYAGRRD